MRYYFWEVTLSYAATEAGTVYVFRIYVIVVERSVLAEDCPAVLYPRPKWGKTYRITKDMFPPAHLFLYCFV